MSTDTTIRRLAHGVRTEETFGYSQGCAFGAWAVVAGQVARPSRRTGPRPTPEQVAEAAGRVVRTAVELGLDSRPAFVRVHTLPGQLGPALDALGAQLTDGSAVSVEPVTALMAGTAAVEIAATVGGESDERAAGGGLSDPLLEAVGGRVFVRFGDLVQLSGLMAYDEDGGISTRGVAAQWAVIERRLDAILARAGAARCCVVATHVALRSSCDDVERQALFACHRHTFETVRPAATVTLVPELAAPEAVVQLTVQAFGAHDCTAPTRATPHGGGFDQRKRGSC